MELTRGILITLLTFGFLTQSLSQAQVMLEKRPKRSTPTEMGNNRLFNNVFLTDDYDMNKIPKGFDSTPLLVNFSINLKSILAIDEPNQVISLESTLRLSWYDERIQVILPDDHPKGMSYLLFNREPIEHIWFPDVYVDKAKDLRVPVYKIPPAYLRMYNTSQMLYSARVNYDIACPMSFDNYPVDTQQCEILFESWGSTTAHMIFKWRKEDSVVNSKIKLNQHVFEVEFEEHISDQFSTGVFPGVLLKLKFKRKLSYHMLRTYLPSFLFVTLAWFSMFIPVEHVPGRVTMSMTTMLTLASMFGSLSTITPPISYTTKLDVWMVGCIVFVFATLAEFTVVIFLKYYLMDLHGVYLIPESPTVSVANAIQKTIQTQVPQAWGVSGNGPRPPTAAFNKNREINTSSSSRSKDHDQDRNVKAERLIVAIEKFSVFIFLFSFLTFNVFYWLDIVATKNNQ